jgi:flagellar biosynthesis protein FlhB
LADDGDKTEEPTEHKLRKAREQGNVPRSEDMNGFFMLLFILVTFGIGAVGAYKSVVHQYDRCFTTIFMNNLNLSKECLNIFGVLGIIVIAVFATVIIASFTSYMIINKGFTIPKQPFKFNLQALNLPSNFANLFRKENFVSTVTTIIKEIVFYTVFFLVLNYFLKALIFESFCFENCAGTAILYYILILIGILFILALIFAAIDFPMRIHFYKQKLRMSHKDLKDEHKELDGNPEVKQERNNFRWELLNGTPKGPGNATFFIRGGNIIFGIRYNRAESPAPIIVAIGRGDSAQKISQIAQSKRRMIIFDDDFAGKLSKMGKMGRPVPLEFVGDIRGAIAKLREYESQNGPTHPPAKK